MIKRIIQFIKDILPSRETLVRTLKRAVSAGIISAAATFVLIPINLEEPRKYLISVLIGVASGFLQGLVKFITGYVKYDLS